MGDDKQQKELKKILQSLLQQPENKFCADCGSSRPTWASSKIGIFICMKCAGIHRGLGTHLSFVRSVELDKWKLSEVEVMQEFGNLKAAQIYESTLPPNYPRPPPTDGVALEKFIRAKYQYKKFYNENGANGSTTSGRRPSLERRLENESVGPHNQASPRKVIRKPQPGYSKASTWVSLSFLPTRTRFLLFLVLVTYLLSTQPHNNANRPTPPVLTTATQPVNNNSISLFDLPTTTTPQPTSQSSGSLFGSLEVTKNAPVQQQQTNVNNNNTQGFFNENKACSTQTKNEILSLFDQNPAYNLGVLGGFGVQPQVQQPTTAVGNGLGDLFSTMSVSPQPLGQVFPQQQPVYGAFPSFPTYQQPLLQQQQQQQLLFQQQLQQQQLQQQQLYQQQFFQQQNDSNDLLNKIQAKSAQSGNQVQQQHQTSSPLMGTALF